jgi:hypothetical protein
MRKFIAPPVIPMTAEEGQNTKDSSSITGSAGGTLASGGSEVAAGHSNTAEGAGGVMRSSQSASAAGDVSASLGQCLRWSRDYDITDATISLYFYSPFPMYMRHFAALDETALAIVKTSRSISRLLNDGLLFISAEAVEALALVRENNTVASLEVDRCVKIMTSAYAESPSSFTTALNDLNDANNKLQNSILELCRLEKEVYSSAKVFAELVEKLGSSSKNNLYSIHDMEVDLLYAKCGVTTEMRAKVLF